MSSTTITRSASAAATWGSSAAATVERVLRVIGNDIPGEIVGHRIELYVTCDRCITADGS